MAQPLILCHNPLYQPHPYPVGIQKRCKISDTHFFSLLLHRVLFRSPLAGRRMKRESGESPEQSRCCEPIDRTSNL